MAGDWASMAAKRDQLACDRDRMERKMESMVVDREGQTG